MSVRLVAGYAFKYEPDWLIEDLRENLSWVDGFVSLNQRDRTDELWSPRSERVAALQSLARDIGAEWMLIMDPDERLEDRAEVVVRALIEHDPKARFTFNFRELFSPTEYRVDGVWGQKTRRRLFHLSQLRAPRMRVDLNIYHLKHIEPGNGALRSRVFQQANYWDNHRLGFEYLADEEGMVLESIPEGRGYRPAYDRPYRFEVPERLLD